MLLTKEEISEIGNVIRELKLEVEKLEKKQKEAKMSGGYEGADLIETELYLIKERLTRYQMISLNAEESIPSKGQGGIQWQTRFIGKVNGIEQKMYIVSNLPGEKDGMTRVPLTSPLGKAIINKQIGLYKVKFGDNEATVNILNIV